MYWVHIQKLAASISNKSIAMWFACSKWDTSLETWNQGVCCNTSSIHTQIYSLLLYVVIYPNCVLQIYNISLCLLCSGDNCILCKCREYCRIFCDSLMDTDITAHVVSYFNAVFWFLWRSSQCTLKWSCDWCMSMTSI